MNVLSTLFLLVGSLVTAVMFSQGIESTLAFFPIIVASALQILTWWFSYVSRAAIASSPTSLQLVPGFRHGVFINTLLLMCGLGIVLAAIFAGARELLPLVWIVALGLMFRSSAAQRIVFAAGSVIWMFALSEWLGFDLTAFGHRAPIPGVTHAILLWGAAASAIGFVGIVGIARLYPWLGTVFAVAYLATLFAGLRVPGFELITELHSNTFVAGPSDALGMALVAAFFTGLTLMMLAGQRGDRAIAYFKRNADLRAAMANLTDPGARGNWSISSRGSQINATLFNRIVASAGDGTPKRLMPFGLGPRMHWASFAIVCIFGGVFCLLIPLLPAFTKTESTVLAPYLPFVILFGPMTIPDVILRTWREQNLLSLTPAWPARGLLNRWMISFIGTRVAIAWIACVTAIASMTFAYSLPLANFTGPAVAATLCALLLYGYSLKEYTREFIGHRGAPIGMMALLLAFAAIGIVTHFDSPAGRTVAVIAASITCFVGWRMQKVLRGPAILPAGHLAKTT